MKSRPEVALKGLSQVLHHLTVLEPGSYLLRRERALPTFSLWRSGESLLHAVAAGGMQASAAGATSRAAAANYNLHAAQRAAGATDCKTITYVMPAWSPPPGEVRIPFTFPPAKPVE